VYREPFLYRERSIGWWLDIVTACDAVLRVDRRLGSMPGEPVRLPLTLYAVSRVLGAVLAVDRTVRRMQFRRVRSLPVGRPARTGNGVPLPCRQCRRVRPAVSLSNRCADRNTGTSRRGAERANPTGAEGARLNLRPSA
jgi:hypothetical protein